VTERAEIRAPERRARDRSQGIALRRRQGQLVYTRHERRRTRHSGFDVAAALEMHLDRFPTREALVVLLDSWLYQAERSGLCDEREAYCTALELALDTMKAAPDPVAAITVLQRH
jgi:hypothetical protein